MSYSEIPVTPAEEEAMLQLADSLAPPPMTITWIDCQLGGGEACRDGDCCCPREEVELIVIDPPTDESIHAALCVEEGCSRCAA